MSREKDTSNRQTTEALAVLRDADCLFTAGEVAAAYDRLAA
jgi:hypothetical protein